MSDWYITTRPNPKLEAELLLNNWVSIKFLVSLTSEICVECFKDDEKEFWSHILSHWIYRKKFTTNQKDFKHSRYLKVTIEKYGMISNRILKKNSHITCYLSILINFGHLDSL